MTGSALPNCITEIISQERFEKLKIVSTDQFESVINGFFEMIKKESMKMTTLPLSVLTYLSREGFKKQHVFFESSLELIQWFEVKMVKDEPCQYRNFVGDIYTKFLFVESVVRQSLSQK
jgi:hypothetical protein